MVYLQDILLCSMKCSMKTFKVIYIKAYDKLLGDKWWVAVEYIRWYQQRAMPKFK